MTENTSNRSQVWSGLMGADPRDLIPKKTASPSFSSEPGTPRDVAAPGSFAIGGPVVAPAGEPAKPPKVKIKSDFMEEWFG